MALSFTLGCQIDTEEHVLFFSYNMFYHGAEHHENTEGFANEII